MWVWMWMWMGWGVFLLLYCGTVCGSLVRPVPSPQAALVSDVRTAPPLRDCVVQHLPPLCARVRVSMLELAGARQEPQANVLEVHHLVHPVGRPAHVEHVGAEGALLDLLHLLLFLVVGLAGGEQRGVQYVHFQTHQVVRLRDVADQHRLVRVRLADLAGPALHHLLEQVQCAGVVLHEVEAGVHEEGRVAGGAGAVVHEEDVLVQALEVGEGVLEPGQVHVLEEHVEAPVQRQEDRGGLEPHHAAEGLVQVALGCVLGHAAQGGVVHGGGAHVLDQGHVALLSHEDDHGGYVHIGGLCRAHEVEQQVHDSLVGHHHDGLLAPAEGVHRLAHLGAEVAEEQLHVVQQRPEQQVLVVDLVRVVLREVSLVLVGVQRGVAHSVALLHHALRPLRHHSHCHALVRLVGPGPRPRQIYLLARRV
mmetsp:Transcript_35665/g.76937  ORF Transcript_35665/g.76937 Transcript_35665/m.76937 type:complete len:420 (-) Transcript_35665:544-1803(-)